MNKDNILGLLKSMQQKHGYLTNQAIYEVSEEKGIPVNQVYSVASFYSLLNIKSQGKYVIRLCNSLPCYMKGSFKMLEILKDKLEISPGHTTKDKKFSLELVNCIGACDMAPAMLINDKLYGNLTKQKIIKIIDGYR